METKNFGRFSILRIPRTLRLFCFYLLLHFAASSLDAQIVYSNNFEVSVGPRWSLQTREITPVGNRTFLGRFGNSAPALTLTNLAAHTEVELDFDLFIIGTWDGSSPSNGPDILRVSVENGPTLLRSSFAPVGSRQQSYRQ
jgi:hypothetical protein